MVAQHMKPIRNKHDIVQNNLVFDLRSCLLALSSEFRCRKWANKSNKILASTRDIKMSTFV